MYNLESFSELHDELSVTLWHFGLGRLFPFHPDSCL